jgi:hypothetical protein
VARLKHDLEDLLGVVGPVTLEVEPTWQILGHEGAITDRTFPHANLPCPYLEQGSEVRVSMPAISSADIRRTVLARALMEMNLRSVDGNPSPYDLIYGEASATCQPGAGELPPPGAGPARGNGAPSSSEVPAGNAVEEWGSICSRSMSWGRPDPPPHLDEGIEWSNASVRAARADWDRRMSSGSPPPKVLTSDLFSDRGDGFPLSHLRRAGENAETMTIAPEYVSSGSRSGKNTKRRLRESRKTPFPPSPTKGEADRNTSDDDWDMILEDQRLADVRAPTEHPPIFSPKRRQEVLSDQDYRLRKERTDGLVEGHSQESQGQGGAICGPSLRPQDASSGIR